MICRHCGQQVEDAATYCTACGREARELEGSSYSGLRELLTPAEPPHALNRLMLVGVVIVSLVAALVCVGLFLLPPEHLRVPGIQPAARVAPVADFRVGTSRMVRWGDRAILVVRRTEARYYAMQGTASSDGCFLRWEPDALQVISPCTHGVYDLQGHVIAGLTTKPLKRYAVFERDGVVYVTES